MATPWLRGTVREVPSGDTLVVAGPSKGGPPPTKRITLASLIAPRLGRRDGSSQDEAFAWASREFLRQKCIGQPCTFRVEYTLDNIPGREFGSIFIGAQNENVAASVVAAGWAKVRSPGGSQSAFYDDLAAAQSAAESQGLGLWTKEESAHAKAVRDIPVVGEGGLDPLEMLQTSRDKPLPGIVEQVVNGSVLRLTLLPDFHPINVMVAGVQAPSMGRRPPPTAAPAAAANGDASEGKTAASVAAAASSAGTASETPGEAYAAQARYFTETRVLNREIRVILKGADKYNNLFGQIKYTDQDQAVDLGSELVTSGSARTVDWGLRMLDESSAFKLREAERTAKQQRIGQWVNWTPPATPSSKLSGDFTGTVTEIVSGDCIVVADSESGSERRVTLSSVRAPKIGRRQDTPEPYAIEAKEFLRSKLIGKEVSVSLEYTRKVPINIGEAGVDGATDNKVLSLGTVTIADKDQSGQPRNSNVAELALSRGLVRVVQHRPEEERSMHYESLVTAEQTAKKNKKGIHSGKEPAPFHVNDVSVAGSGKKAQQYLPFLTRGRLHATVDYCLSGHRLKLYIPKEGAMIAFSPSGVRTPSRAQAASNRGPATKEEPFWEEAAQFTRRHCLQRDVEIEIETCDRGGTFLGSLELPGPKHFDLGLALLEAGLGSLHPSFDASRVSNGTALMKAEAGAKSAKRKIWQNWSPPAEGSSAESNGTANGHASGPRETMHVTVTEVASGREFFVQKAEEPRVAWLAEQLRELALSSSGSKAGVLKVGALCLAQFTLDDQWYRARVEEVHSKDPINPQYTVSFLDFGNREKTGGAKIKPIDAALSAVPPQAIRCRLAYCKAPKLDAELGQEAAQHLSSLLGDGRKLLATVEAKERAGQSGPAASEQLLHLILCSPEDTDVGASVNAEMLTVGLARLQPPRGSKAVASKDTLEKLAEAEERAKSAHEGLWMYGDPGSESDEEEPVRKAWGRR